MAQSPQLSLALARARQAEILLEARRHALGRDSRHDRPGALRRLAALRRRRTQPAAAAPATSA